MEVKQSVKFILFSEVISTLIKKYITDMIDETIFELKGCFVIAFGARATPSFNTTACDVTGSVRSVGQLTNNHFFTFRSLACLNGGRRT